jgi:ribonuclease HII
MRKKVRSNIQKIVATGNKRSKKVEWVIGIDEVGRGPIAGPVTLCAFAVRTQFLKDLNAMGFRDSKKLSPQKREQFAQILNNCAQLQMCTWAIESTSAELIDSKGLTLAIKSALERCLKKIDIHPEFADVYLDGGLHAPKEYFRQHTVIHGDDLFPVISSASILAKVYRDKLMEKYDVDYPEYGFFDNKGYGTPEHMKRVRKHGMSPLHRRSFLKSLL